MSANLIDKIASNLKTKGFKVERVEREKIKELREAVGYLIKEPGMGEGLFYLIFADMRYSRKIPSIIRTLVEKTRTNVVLLTKDSVLLVGLEPYGTVLETAQVFDAYYDRRSIQRKLEELKELDPSDSGIYKRTRELLEKWVDREKRVKELGLLIAAYIRHYLKNPKMFPKLPEKLRSVVDKIVIQIGILYFFHKLGSRRNESGEIEDLKSKLIEKYEETLNIFEKLLDAGKEGEVASKKALELVKDEPLWELFGEDLRRIEERVTKNMVFRYEEWKKLNDEGVRIDPELFIGDLFAAKKLRYKNLEHLKRTIEKIVGLEKKKSTSAEKLSEVERELKSLGMVAIWDIRMWFENMLIGDIIGGIYEGLKRIEERQKRGIYYTPRYIVKYIVDNTLNEYLKERFKEIFGFEWNPLENSGELETLLLRKLSETELKQKISTFYKQLLDVKVLDPACGTGHFLVYAMEVFEKWYAAIASVAKKMGLDGTLQITILKRENGGTKIVNKKIKDIDEDVLPFIVRQHLILRNNVYGVDIDEDAHIIAKARLTIESFKHFKEKAWEKGLVLPDLEVNIKKGNSLIGFASWNEIEQVLKKGKHITLFDFSENRKPTTLKRLLELMGQVKKGRDVIAYEQIMSQIRDELDSAYLDFLREKGVKISLGEVKELKPFHWIIEFPDAFFEFSNGSARPRKNAGFDIIVGNPPYHRISGLNNKKEITTLYQLYSHTSREYNLYGVFVERSTYLWKRYISMIIHKNFTTLDTFERLRKYLYPFVREITDLGKDVFDVTAETIVFILDKEGTRNKKFLTLKRYKIENRSLVLILKERVIDSEYKDIIEKYNNRYIVASRIELDILDYLATSFQEKLKDVANIFQGIKTGNNRKYLSDSRKGDQWYPILRGRDIRPFGINGFAFINYKEEELANPLYPHLLRERKAVLQQNSVHPIAYFDSGNFYALNSTTIITSAVIDPAALVVFLNSTLVNWLFPAAFTNRSTITVNILPNNLGMLPIAHAMKSNKVKHVLTTCTHYIQFLVTYNAQKIAQLVRNYGDALIYELYFKDKFYEDGLYPKPKYYLLEAVSKHLKLINYDEWAKLYWRKKIYDDLSEEEERRLKELEKQNLKTVQEVVEALKKDLEVQKWVKKIMHHPWVETIEEEIGKTGR